jgi:hypothetical protein
MIESKTTKGQTTMTLAETKRRIHKGTRVTLTYHKYAHQWRDVSVREALITGAGYTRTVSVVQTVAIAFTMPDGRFSWLHWPKAAEFRSADNDTFSILEDGDVLMTYRIEQQ